MGEKRLQSRRRWFRPRPKHPLPPQLAQCKYPGKAVNKEIRRWGHHPKTASLGDQLGRRGLLRARRRERSSVVALWCDLFCIMWGVMPVTCGMWYERDMCDGFPEPHLWYLPPLQRLLLLGHSGIIHNWTFCYHSVSHKIELSKNDFFLNECIHYLQWAIPDICHFLHNRNWGQEILHKCVNLQQRLSCDKILCKILS